VLRLLFGGAREPMHTHACMLSAPPSLSPPVHPPPRSYIQSVKEKRKAVVLEYKAKFRAAKLEARGPEHRCAWKGRDKKGHQALCTNAVVALTAKGARAEFCG
jgi:hypothetical protein